MFKLKSMSRNEDLSCKIFILQAVGRGLRDPSFRVIQNHFAITGNLGEVSAKVSYLLISWVKCQLRLAICLFCTP